MKAKVKRRLEQKYGRTLSAEDQTRIGQYCNANSCSVDRAVEALFG